MPTHNPTDIVPDDQVIETKQAEGEPLTEDTIPSETTNVETQKPTHDEIEDGPEKIEKKEDSEEETHEEKPHKETTTKLKPEEELTQLRTTHETVVKERDSFKTEAETYKTQYESIKNTEAALEELKKEPLIFLKRYFPQLAETINPRGYITGKVQEKYKDVTFIPEDAFTPGTPSYEMRMYEDEVKDNLMREQARLDHEKLVATEAHNKEMAEAKAKVIKEFGLSEDQYKAFVKEVSTKKIGPFEIAQIHFLDKVIQKRVDEALKVKGDRRSTIQKPKKGAKDIADENDGGSADSQKEESEIIQKEMSDTFGDTWS